MPPGTRSGKKGLPPPPAHDTPPTYSVDLSLPAPQRHRHIATAYRDRLSPILRPLYRDVLSTLPGAALLDRASQVFLRRLHSRDETEELRTYATETGVPMHMLVAYNVFLDLMMGCISGGVVGGSTGTMLHFRGLDWGMDTLRPLVLALEFLRDGETVAHTLTYAGYIGVLTGVRAGLSMSLNYRATLAGGLEWLRIVPHWLAVLLGLRPSISSRLRGLLLAPTPVPGVEGLVDTSRAWVSSPCYLLFCTPTRVVLLEKGFCSARVMEESWFAAVANHDVEMEEWDEDAFRALAARSGGVGMKELVADSRMRKQLVADAWRRRGSTTSGGGGTVRLRDVIKWLQIPEVTNECTHFSCVMDPAAGTIVWSRWWRESPGTDYSG